jgi:quinol monooxygenase YgiN
MAFVRVGRFKVKDGAVDELCRAYSAEAIPTIRAAKGNAGAFLLRPREPESGFLAVTIWISREDAEAYDCSGQAQKMVDTIGHLFASPPKLLTYDAYGFEEL